MNVEVARFFENIGVAISESLHPLCLVIVG